MALTRTGVPAWAERLAALPPLTLPSAIRSTAMKRLPWQHVIVICVVLVCVTALALTGHDNAGLLTIGLAVFGGLGIVGSQTQAVKEQTNGNTSALVGLVRELSHMAYAATPPLGPLPPLPVPPGPSQPLTPPASEETAPATVDTLPAWPPVPTQRPGG